MINSGYDQKLHDIGPLLCMASPCRMQLISLNGEIQGARSHAQRGAELSSGSVRVFLRRENSHPSSGSRSSPFSFTPILLPSFSLLLVFSSSPLLRPPLLLSFAPLHSSCSCPSIPSHLSFPPLLPCSSPLLLSSPPLLPSSLPLLYSPPLLPGPLAALETSRTSPAALLAPRQRLDEWRRKEGAGAGEAVPQGPCQTSLQPAWDAKCR